MTDRKLHGKVVVGTLCTLGLLLAGCETNEGRQARVARRAVTSLEETRTELVRADQEVNQALAALNQLSSEPRDLKQAYRAFSTEVSDTTRQSEAARERAEEMREQWREYIVSWEQEMDQVASPELRASAAERRQSVGDKFNTLRDMARDLQEAYEPFVAQLRDIQRSLSLDLTSAGVAAAEPAIEVAQQRGDELRQRIDAFITELDTITAQRTGRQPSGAERASEY